MTARDTRGDWDDKIAQILDDPVDAERTPKELAMVEAELKQPVSLNRLSSDPSYRKKRDTLKLILDYTKSETTNNASSPPNKSKRSTAKDEGQENLIAADDILLELGKAVEPEDTPSPLDSKPERPKPTSDREHSIDFRSVRWFDELYYFTAKQSAVVRLLYEHWEAGTPDVGDETLLQAADPEAPPERLNVLFRNHPAWSTMIIPGGSKGTHRLEKPTEKKCKARAKLIT